MEDILIKTHIVLLFIVYVYCFFRTLKRGPSFALGILFGVLYYIFIPYIILIATGTLEISKADYSQTNLHDIEFAGSIGESAMLIAYLYTILLFTCLAGMKRRDVKWDNPLRIRWEAFFAASVALSAIILIASGLHHGGNWYTSRETFFRSYGVPALLLIYITWATKLISIASMLASFALGKMTLARSMATSFFVGIAYALIDGNRIYAFVTLAGLLILVLWKYGTKVLIYIALSLPFGYFFSIFRHVRVGMFKEGLPNPAQIYELSQQALRKEPVSAKAFLMGISESVNLNVVYEIFKYITPENALWGKTYAKVLFFVIPRNMWPGKPESITVFAAHWFAPQAPHLSLVTTIIGEAHANFSILGIIILPMMLLLIDTILNRILDYSMLSRIIQFSIGILMFRMPFSDVMLDVVAILILLVTFGVKIQGNSTRAFSRRGSF